MKKFLVTAAICGVLITSNVMASSNVHLFIDGTEKKADIILKDDRTFVPIRFISESMNYKVDYDDATKGIKISKGNETMDLKVGSKEFVKDGKKGKMDVKAFINNDRTFVPLRFIGEAFSKEVGWHQDSRSVYIGKKPAEFPKPDKNGYQVKEFPKFGFKIFVPNNFDDKILIRENKEGNGIIFHSKFVDNYMKDAGFLKSLSLVRDDTPYDSWTGTKPLIKFDGKMLLGEHSLDFFQGSGKYYDDMEKCFDIMDNVVVMPFGNVFPSTKNISSSIENGNFVYKFKDSQVIVTMPLNKLEEILLTIDEEGLKFIDKKNDHPGGWDEDGWILTLYHYETDTNDIIEDSEMPGGILGRPGKIVVSYNGPSDVRHRDEEEYVKSYNQNKKFLVDNLNIKIGDKNYKLKDF